LIPIATRGEDRDHAAAFADLEDQGVGGDEGERACVVRRRVRKSSTCASRSAAIALTCDLERPVIPTDWTSLFIRQVEMPSRWQAATTVVSLLGPEAALEQPLREVRPLPELGNCDIEVAGAGVEVWGP
jgi:hypothetical protein